MAKIFFLLFLVSRVFLSFPQDYEIGYKLGPSLSFPFSDKRHDFDSDIFEMQPHININFGVISNVRLGSRLTLSSGIGLNFNKYKILHKDLKYDGLEDQVAIYPDYISFEIPLYISYETTDWSYFFAGGFLAMNKFSNVFISNAPKEFINENGDSVHVSFTGNFKDELSFTPGILFGTGLKLNSSDEKILELQLYYSLCLTGISEIEYYSRIFDNQTEIINKQLFNPYLSYINLQLVLYPKYIFIQRINRDQYPAED